MRAIKLAVAIYLVAAGALADPHPPSARKNQQGSHPYADQMAEKLQTDERGTAKKPLVVRTVLTQEEEQRQFEEHAEKAEIDLGMLWFTGLLALVTSILAVFTAFLWSATKKMVKGADDTAKRQLGAFVFVKEIKPIPVLRAPNSVEAWKFNPVMKNSGSTRTRRLVTGIDWKLSRGDLPADFGFPDREGEAYPTILVGPDSSVEIDGPTITVDQFASTFEGMGSNRVFLWGWIEYDDVFEGTQRQRTEFCLEIFPIGNIVQSDQIGKEGYPFMFSTYPRHNGAYDDEGVKKPRPYPRSNVDWGARQPA